MPKVLDWQQDWPPATLACKHGNFDDLVKALDEGADPTLANPRGSTCLMICAVYGHVEMLELLVSKLVEAGRLSDLDAKRESDGQTAYHQACFWNRQACAIALVKAGCDTGATEKYGKVGREMAASRKLKELVAALDALGVVQEGEKASGGDTSQLGQIIGSEDAKAELPKPETPEERAAKAQAAAAAAAISAAAERTPLAAAVAESSTGLAHTVLNEPSTGLYFIHKHVRRTAPPMAGLREEINEVRSGSKQRCMDVDDITPLVDDITSMSHISNVRQLVADSLRMVAPSSRSY